MRIDRLKISVLSMGILFLSACAQQPKEEPRLALGSELMTQGAIIDLHSGKAISAEQLVQQLAEQPLVIVGEKHDNLYHHQIEQWLAQEMTAIRPQGAVLLEMLNPDQQQKVDQVKQSLQSDPYVRDEKIQAALSWQQGWPWAQYGELTKALLKAPYPLLTANLDRSEIKQAYANPPAIKGIYSTQPLVQSLISQTIDSSHGGQLSADQINKMTVIQQMRDRRMAESILKAPQPALLFAGGYHATRAIGVPLHIQDLSPDTSVAVLILSEKGSEIDNLHADYVWYTPEYK